MKVYYKISHVIINSCFAGRSEYDERQFFVERSIEEYVHYRDVYRESFLSTANVDSDWFIDVDNRRLFKRCFKPIREDEFAEWFIEKSATDAEIAAWDLQPLGESLTNVRVLRDYAVEIFLSRKKP